MIVYLFLTIIWFLFQSQVNSQFASVNAELYLYGYDPQLQFRLLFSQPVILPQFQILLNNINLTYAFTTTSNFSNKYQVTILNYIKSLDTTIQTYSLVFNYPLNVANGQLNLADFIMEPIRSPVILDIPDWPAYFLFAFVYAFSFFGIIGLRLVDFIQMFMLAEYQFNHTTTIYQFIGQIFLFDIRQTIVLDSSYIFQIALPTLIVLATYIICSIIKIVLKNTQNSYLIQLRHFFVFNFFLSVWSIFSMPILYKGCQYVHLSNLNLIFLDKKQKIICSIITYLNFLLTALYIYLLWFTLNPVGNGGKQEFSKYIESQEFSQYQKLHLRTILTDGRKRNYMILHTVRKYTVVVLYFQIPNLIDVIFIEQILIMLYMNTVRPFKNDFYTVFAIIANLLIFIFYLFVVYGNIYFAMSDVLVTSISVNHLLLAKNVVFLLVIIAILVFSGIQNLRIIFDIRYNIKILSWLKKDPNIRISRQMQNIQDRLFTETSQKSASKRMHIHYTIPQIQNLSTSLIFPKNNPCMKSISQKNSASKPKLSLFQVQIQELQSPQKKRVLSKRNSSKKLINQKYKKEETSKWKGNYLFQKLAQTSHKDH